MKESFKCESEDYPEMNTEEQYRKQAKIYKDAGQRSDFTVSFNEKTLPGEQYIVILEWTDDKIMSPGRSGNDIPAEAIEAGKKYRPLVEHDYIEFFETIAPTSM